MVFTRYAVFLLGASALSVSAQLTPAPAPSAAPAAAPAPGAPAAPAAAAPNAQGLPLTALSYTYPNLPYQVDPLAVGRGPQSGYNICNSTTEGPNSMCQTMFVNTIDDFCLWGSPTPNGAIGDVEAEVVAYCTKKGHGTRLIAPGALTAVQFIKTPGYIQLTGLIDQTTLGLTASDAGGELDPHGADLAGNPLGGLVFSNNLPTATNNNTFTQVNNWNNFLGGGVFCIKACDNSITNPDYCQNTFDTQGCSFNMPASYAPNEFTSCLGDNQAPAGGNPVIPATSSCITYTSSLIYSTVSTTSTSATAKATSPPTTASPQSGKASTTTTSKSGAISPIAGSGVGFLAVASSLFMASLAGMVVLL